MEIGRKKGGGGLLLFCLDSQAPPPPPSLCARYAGYSKSRKANIIHLGGQRHHESKVSCSRTQRSTAFGDKKLISAAVPMRRLFRGNPYNLKSTIKKV